MRGDAEWASNPTLGTHRVDVARVSAGEMKSAGENLRKGSLRRRLSAQQSSGVNSVPGAAHWGVGTLCLGSRSAVGFRRLKCNRGHASDGCGRAEYAQIWLVVDCVKAQGEAHGERAQ